MFRVQDFVIEVWVQRCSVSLARVGLANDAVSVLGLDAQIANGMLPIQLASIP